MMIVDGKYQKGLEGYLKRCREEDRKLNPLVDNIEHWVGFICFVLAVGIWWFFCFWMINKM